MIEMMSLRKLMMGKDGFVGSHKSLLLVVLCDDRCQRQDILWFEHFACCFCWARLLSHNHCVYEHEPPIMDGVKLLPRVAPNSDILKTKIF